MPALSASRRDHAVIECARWAEIDPSLGVAPGFDQAEHLGIEVDARQVRTRTWTLAGAHEAPVVVIWSPHCRDDVLFYVQQLGMKTIGSRSGPRWESSRLSPRQTVFPD